MTPERQRQIEELYNLARQHEPEKCAAILADYDPEIRSQVERMLVQGPGGKILDSPVPVTVGSKLGPYKIEGVLGMGGMGEVFRAVDTRLDRMVAIKISRLESMVAIKISHERFSGRFEREARIIAALNHPNICTLHDVGPNYLVMELVEGETLSDRLKRGKLSLHDTLRYGVQIAEALAAAHSKGISHRDLKPGNIMVTKSSLKVLDFGLAKSPQDETLTASRAFMGTPAYMAPEQMEGKECDARTDIYALGLVLKEMATGNRASQSQAPLSDFPLHFAHVVERCLTTDPESRWQAAADVRAELEWAEKNRRFKRRRSLGQNISA